MPGFEAPRRSLGIPLRNRSRNPREVPAVSPLGGRLGNRGRSIMPPTETSPWEDATLDLRRIELQRVDVPMVEAFRSAVGERTVRRALYVRLECEDGSWGIGECSARPDPYFNGEFVAGSGQVLREFVIPRLGSPTSLAELQHTAEKVRNWPFTLSALIEAAVDCLRRRGLPDPLDTFPGPASARVPVGISLGLFSSPDEGVERVARAVDEGYRRIKLKVAPTVDLEILRAIRAAFPAAPLAFDANGSLGEGDLGLIEALADLEPLFLEQPFAPPRLDLSAALRKQRPDLRVCLDEGVANFGQLAAAQGLGALDELNLKPGRVGGPLRAAEMLRWCRAEGIPVWVGGMFETGVGRLANLRTAARTSGSGHDLSPSRRYFERDVVSEPLDMDTDGTIHLDDDSPVALDSAALEDFTVERVGIDIGCSTR